MLSNLTEKKELKKGLKRKRQKLKEYVKKNQEKYKLNYDKTRFLGVKYALGDSSLKNRTGSNWKSHKNTAKLSRLFNDD